MRLVVDPSTLVSLPADGKLFSPVIDPPSFFFSEREKNLVRFVSRRRMRSPIAINGQVFLNGKSKIDDHGQIIRVNVFKNKFRAH